MGAARTVVALSVVAAIAGCSAPLSTREKGTLAGGAIGAGTGAIIGSQVGHPGAGALIGAGVGAVSGALIGDAVQGAEQNQAAAAPPPPPPPQTVVVAPPPPPPPQVVVAPAPPSYLWVPEWGVYVMENQDVAYYQNAYYYYHGGRWYISRRHSGPWVLVASPPPVIGRLPRGHFHRHLPPGHARKRKSRHYRD